ncbi:hypothetical protein BTZ20_1628 [Rhodococcus sp. MTM3W5.2]|uniref:anti-sigma-D factor RsdA n=1 Tax=Rhodococcus sp. MTM3W5.2 TaxID=1805827 RepID=UPI0009796665|nr:anti-sigma-D factor RsdA [Rhodococcus sp. MTM3W5.2]AQA23403.1 hypothetical protein BTZ20_1628 [Rhodococcus sp. MTM3W5.2]
MARGSKRGGDHEGTQRDTSGADLTPDASSLGDEESADATAVDFAAIARDDALIDAIAGDGPIATNSPEEFELATLLTAWRAEILAPPCRPSPISTRWPPPWTGNSRRSARPAARICGCSGPSLALPLPSPS